MWSPWQVPASALYVCIDNEWILAVTTRKRKLSSTEMAQAFAEGSGTQYPPIMTVEQLEELLQRSRKTIYEWIAKGRFDGAFRKRGKRHMFWRDRVIDIMFNKEDWT